MTTAVRARALSIALVVLVVSSCVVAGAGVAQAQPLPRSVPLTAVFDDLAVGQSASRSWTVDIPREAAITNASVARVGDASVAWSAKLCPTTGRACVDLLDAPDGARLAAGTYRLGVGITIVALSDEPSQSIEGHLTFVEHASGSLAMTGADSVLQVVLVATAAVTVGLLLAVLAGRRRADETNPSNGAL